MAADSPIIEVQHLSHQYPDGVRALNDVSFKVQPGEFLVVIGLSGSGKSTLLRSLNRLLDPSDGKVLYKGQDVTHVTGQQVRQLRQQVAMIFQSYNLVPRQNVLSNILMGRLSHTSTMKSLLHVFSRQDQQIATELLRMVGLEEKAYVRADQLSGGQQQRVAIARALAQKPSVLLADEPVASLDPATSHSIMDYLKKINQEMGLTVICNLHFLSLVRQYASRVIALRDGRLVFTGSPQEITQDWFKQIYGAEAKDVQIN
ncbi:MAG: phosphonate ABC transporter ATP-binding protein [Bdellovibrionales bacterium]